jgi:hypothetical protein
VEKVVATMEIPSSHHGMFLPDAKNSTALDPAFRATPSPMARETTKKAMIDIQSIHCSIIFLLVGHSIKNTPENQKQRLFAFVGRIP